MSNHLKGVLLVSVTALLWGILAIFLKLALTDMGPINIVWYRFTLAFLILFIYSLFFKKEAIRSVSHPPKWALFAGGMLALNYLGYMKGVELGGPNLTQIVIQTGPLLFALSGIIIFKEKISKAQIIGFLISVGGYILFYLDKWEELSRGRELLWATLIILIAAGSWAIYATVQKKLNKYYDGTSLNLVTYGLSSLLYFPFVEWSSFSNLTIGSWGLILFLGLNTIVAYGCLIESFKYIPANQVSVIITMNPILTLIVTYFLYRFDLPIIAYDVLPLSGYLGALAVVSGAIIVIGFSRNKN